MLLAQSYTISYDYVYNIYIEDEENVLSVIYTTLSAAMSVRHSV